MVKDTDLQALINPSDIERALNIALLTIPYKLQGNKAVSANEQTFENNLIVVGTKEKTSKILEVLEAKYQINDQ